MPVDKLRIDYLHIIPYPSHQSLVHIQIILFLAKVVAKTLQKSYIHYRSQQQHKTATKSLTKGSCPLISCEESNQGQPGGGAQQGQLPWATKAH